MSDLFDESLMQSNDANALVFNIHLFSTRNLCTNGKYNFIRFQFEQNVTLQIMKT